MNIRKLQPTDDRAEQIRIGKELASFDETGMVAFIDASFDKISNWSNMIPFSKEEMKYIAIYDFWIYGFIAEQEIYYKLYKKTHAEKSTYLSFKSKFLYFARLNKSCDMRVLEDKYEAYQLLKPYYGRDVIKIEREDDYGVFLDFVSKHPTFVAKPLGLSCAMGVQKIDIKDHADSHELFDCLINIGRKYEDDLTVSEANHDGAVLEELIQQDESINIMHPTSVNGIRITTIRIGNTVHIYYPWIKVGVHGDFIASAASGGFDAGIDAETGIVNTNGYLEDGSFIEEHPDTHVKIKGFVIPRWREAIAMAKEVAMLLPSTINYVGWDFVLTPNGWVVMEGNFYGDTMWQMFYERGMKEDLENLLGWKPEKKFWWQYNLRKLEES